MAKPLDLIVRVSGAVQAAAGQRDTATEPLARQQLIDRCNARTSNRFGAEREVRYLIWNGSSNHLAANSDPVGDIVDTVVKIGYERLFFLGGSIGGQNIARASVRITSKLGALRMPDFVGLYDPAFDDAASAAPRTHEATNISALEVLIVHQSIVEALRTFIPGWEYNGPVPRPGFVNRDVSDIRDALYRSCRMADRWATVAELKTVWFPRVTRGFLTKVESCVGTAHTDAYSVGRTDVIEPKIDELLCKGI